MTPLADLLVASERFALDALDRLNVDDRQAVADAVERGCMIEVRINGRLASKVRLLLLTPDGQHAMEIGRSLERSMN